MTTATRLGRVCAVAALLAGLATTGLVTGSMLPAGACSFRYPTITVDEPIRAGGTVVVRGEDWFDVVGDIGADCTGDFDLVPREDVVVSVTFDTPGGPVTDQQTAVVDTVDFSIGPLSFPVPDDATSVTATAGPAEPQTLLVEPGPTTTTVPPSDTPQPAPQPAPVPDAPTAVAVTGAADYTG